ncbi:hypothetical protein [Ketobacter alkanivorans]|uniref:Uncharacterized protein n=1 Tax=Ketobacter alkanivorans TaxID=1917421 RepID=A0A2K9LKV7_9GAMM|nr:hypothetical protein [Ketobacter alkanivorans]AUM11404.1 hypothetical protein Kalk_02735 [Ketobacter alkanivorans]MCP5019469.1 hypothetical protein [Ketobacter sp.]
MNRLHKLIRIPLLTVLAITSQAAWSLDEGTTIIGTKEAPNVLNVVPWQNRELNIDPWEAKPTLDSQLLNDSLKPVDQDELRRQVEYFNLLQHSDPK